MERIQEIQSSLEKGHFNAECEYEIAHLLAENKRLQDAYDEWHPLGDKEALMKRRITQQAQKE